MDSIKKMWLTQQEAMSYLNISRTQLYLLRKKFKIPYTQLGRKLMFKKEDLDDLLMKNYVGSKQSNV